MVNLLIVVDPDAERRSAYLKGIRPILPLVENLQTSSLSKDDFAATWAGGTWTPVDSVNDSQGIAVIWGNAFTDNSGPANTRTLRQEWTRSLTTDAATFDGFHAAVVYTSKGELKIGADLLGAFPIYYYSTEEIILVGTSPELFLHHPNFTAALNPEGLIGILLTKGLFRGQTLLSGVKRLSPGHVLLWRSGSQTKEIQQYKLPISTKFFNLSLREHADLLNEALTEAITKHAPAGNQYCLMLSGGLDSRVLAGSLKRNKINVVALTEGLVTDNEMKCAIPVANALGFKHVPATIQDRDYPAFADLAAKWEHMNEGFGAIMFWGFRQHLRKISNRVISGYMMDGVLGGTVSWAYSPSKTTKPFEAFFQNLNSWAFTPTLLRKLLKKERLGNMVSKVQRKIREEYESYSSLEFQRAWGFGLHHRLRFHVGSVIWPLSFGAWPVLPFADRKVLEIAGGLPATSLFDRRAERELLCKYFPTLARLSLNGVTYDTTPLVPTPRQKAMQTLYGDTGIWKIRGLIGLRYLIMELKGERRYYMRTSDFNSLGWKAVRKKAEPFQRLSFDYLNQEVFENLAPSAEENYPHGKWMKETSALKMLIGFSLWLKQHPLSADIQTAKISSSKN